MRRTWRSVLGARGTKGERTVDFPEGRKTTLLYNECGIRWPMEQEHVVVAVANARAARA